jgi:hypothetical protein
MRYLEIEQRRERHPAGTLLRVNHAALALGFFGRVFVEHNVASLPAPGVASELGGEWPFLDQHLADEGFHQSAQAAAASPATPSIKTPVLGPAA